MDKAGRQEMRYLEELCAATGADAGVQVSMTDMGAALGLDKAEAGIIAEDLIIQGLVELRSLSGGISITAQGIEMVQGLTGSTTLPAGQALQLGSGPVLSDQGRSAVERVIGEIRTAAALSKASFSQWEETVIDVKTLEVQLLSPKPKTEVIRQVLLSLRTNLAGLGLQDRAASIDSLISS
ncbi:MAG: hypothetical protein P4L42_04620 [Desulfocapsaceae bacterium]|nr:hypothetical protein [Desulfocapsaceae bacterium]